MFCSEFYLFSPLISQSSFVCLVLISFVCVSAGGFYSQISFCFPALPPSSCFVAASSVSFILFLMFVTAHLLIDPTLCLWSFFIFHVSKHRITDFIATERNKSPGHSAEEASLPHGRRAGDQWLSFWEARGRPLALKQQTCLLLRAPLCLTLNNSINSGSFLTRIIKPGEWHNICYKQQRENNKQTNLGGLWPFSPTFIPVTMACQVNTGFLFRFNNLIIAELPIP